MEQENLLSESDSNLGATHEDNPETPTVTPALAWNVSTPEKIVLNLFRHQHHYTILDPAKLSYALTRLRFHERLTQLQKQLTNFAASATRYEHEHPNEVKIFLLCIVAIATVPVILPAAGFAASGPVAGSLAAAWQSSIGVLAAGSPFAFLQSAAMGGAAAGAFYGVGVAGLAVLAGKKAASWAGEWWNKKNKKAHEEGHGANERWVGD